MSDDAKRAAAPDALGCATDWLGRAEALAAALPAPLRFDELRAGARGELLQRGLPNRRQEVWRTVDLNGFRAQEFAAAAAPRPVDAALLDGLDGALRLVLVDGHYVPSLSRRTALPAGVTVAPLAEVAAERPQLLAALGDVPAWNAEPFSALNTANFTDGVVVHVAAGVQLDETIEIALLSSEDTAAHPRLLVVLEAGARARVTELQRGRGRYFSNPVTEIRLGEGAQYRHFVLQDESRSAWQFASVHAELAAGAQASLHRCMLGGLIGRVDLTLTLAGAGANATLEGLALAADGQLLDSHLTVRHAVAHGASRQTFRGVLKGKSRHVFDGLIRVEQDAQKTDAQQQCRNLLLARMAQAQAMPRLEIFADDVKCAHGATVGELDETALFYLRSRGIGEAEAKALLVRAFAGEFLDGLDDAGWRERLEARIDAWLEA